MGVNSLVKLHEVGQCVWLDNLYRDLITTGKLKQMVSDGVTGITSNPTIFQKAISGSTGYDDSLRALLKKGVKDPKELFLGLAMEDVLSAADVLSAVHEKTNCVSGFVSIEVSPDLAYDTEATIKEARRLFTTLNRKNILVKVPATKAGLPAIEQLISEGINVNVTLLFSIERSAEVAEAYVKGLERRLKSGGKIDGITSVASLFVSRVDTLVDKLLEKRLETASEEEKKTINVLIGTTAVANAKLAYKRCKEIYSGPRFKALKDKGANEQRLLWASTGTKNPKYSDVKYVDELVAPDTVNTMPETTLQAFEDHGKVKVTVSDDLAGAEEIFKRLSLLGIDMTAVTDQLEKEGVKSFSDSFFTLLEEIAKRRDQILAGK